MQSAATPQPKPAVANDSKTASQPAVETITADEKALDVEGFKEFICPISKKPFDDRIPGRRAIVIKATGTCISEEEVIRYFYNKSNTKRNIDPMTNKSIGGMPGNSLEKDLRKGRIFGISPLGNISGKVRVIISKSKLKQADPTIDSVAVDLEIETFKALESKIADLEKTIISKNQIISSLESLNDVKEQEISLRDQINDSKIQQLKNQVTELKREGTIVKQQATQAMQNSFRVKKSHARTKDKLRKMAHLSTALLAIILVFVAAHIFHYFSIFSRNQRNQNNFCDLDSAPENFSLQNSNGGSSMAIMQRLGPANSYVPTDLGQRWVTHSVPPYTFPELDTNQEHRDNLDQTHDNGTCPSNQLRRPF